MFFYIAFDAHNIEYGNTISIFISIICAYNNVKWFETNKIMHARKFFTKRQACWIFPEHCIAIYLCVCIHLTILQDLTYAELMVSASPVQRVHFTSTLGRPSRTSNTKQQEPTIYAQVSILLGLFAFFFNFFSSNLNIMRKN